MAAGAPGFWRSLTTWSPILFRVAGLLVGLFAGFVGLKAFTELAFPVAESVFAGVGGAIGFLGLLGLYPVLNERDPWLVQVGALFAVIGAVGFLIVAVTHAGQLFGVLGGTRSQWFRLITMAIPVTVILGFGAFGIASLRIAAHSYLVGIALLAPAMVFLVILGSVLGTPPDWVSFLLGTAHALAYLTIGNVIRTGVLTAYTGASTL